MISKKDFYCLDALPCLFNSKESIISCWRNIQNGDVVGYIHELQNLNEVFSKKIREKDFVTRTYHKVLPASLSILEVIEKTGSCPNNSFAITKIELMNTGAKLNYFHLPQARYEQFVAVKETTTGLVLVFLYYENEFNDLPQGVLLVELDQSLIVQRQMAYSLTNDLPTIIGVFCSATTNDEIGILMEDEEADAWLYRFSANSISFIERKKLSATEQGFGFIRAMSIKDFDLYLISANWTFFQVSILNGQEVERQRINLPGSKVPMVLFWNGKKWIAGGLYDSLSKIESNAIDFILST